ncbi:MAG: hypothetical protein HXY22_11435 [Alphaproteobacteria bacterium]|nr:hypothetical protein [Alphaproteobacteria bacterium]
MTDDASSSKPKFAALTAGLLARKGEAHPAATVALADDLAPRAYALTRTPAIVAGAQAQRGPQTAKPAPNRPEPAPAAGPLSERLTMIRDRIAKAAGMRIEEELGVKEEAPAPGEMPLPSAPIEEVPLAGDRAPVPASPAPTPASPAPISPAMQKAAPEASAAPCTDCPGDAADARKFHVSVRLKRSRYIRLKLAAAALHRPSQEIIGEALDAYFSKLDESILGGCPCTNG